MAALEDLAAALKMDPLDFFIKNIELTGVRANVYRDELIKAAELIEWKKNWHPRGAGNGNDQKRSRAFDSHVGRNAARQ